MDHDWRLSCNSASNSCDTFLRRRGRFMLAVIVAEALGANAHIGIEFGHGCW